MACRAQVPLGTDLELGFGGPGDDDHPFADVWAFRRGDLQVTGKDNAAARPPTQPLSFGGCAHTSKGARGSAFAASDSCCLHSGAREVMTAVPRAHFWSLAARPPRERWQQVSSYCPSLPRAPAGAGCLPPRESKALGKGRYRLCQLTRGPGGGRLSPQRP